MGNPAENFSRKFKALQLTFRKVSANPCQEVSSRTPRHHCLDSNGVAYASNTRSGGAPRGQVRSILIRSKVSGYRHGTIRLSVSKRTSRISRHQEVSAATGNRVNGTGRANSSLRSGVICQGRNGLRSSGLWPPWSAQACKNARSQW